jgi:putative protease
MTEILAPAGDIQSAYSAINSYADAIYLGLTSFSARSSAENFDFDGLKAIIDYAHLFKVKVYVAMNTLVKQCQLDEFMQNIVLAHNLGADAIIMQDMYLGKYIHSIYPQITLHLSTQAGVNNEYGALLAKECGFSRVILARETRLEDIKDITKIIETEVFVQGALCTCFSGQCYLSSFAGGNSGNRGRCKQPCRKKYCIDRKGFEEQAYRLSLADLNVGEDIDKLIQAGVTSFKIEGRMRRPEYVSAAVTYYRHIIDNKANNDDLSALKRTYNRGNYTKGLTFGQDKSFISSAVQGHIGEYCGVVKVINGKFICLSKVQCDKGDGFKILRDGKEICGATYVSSQKDGFLITSSTRLKNGDKVFITTDASLNEQLINKKRKLYIELLCNFTVGQTAKITIDGNVYSGNFILESAKSHALTKEDVIKCFNKTDTYPFEIGYNDIEISGDIFVAASQLNALRRDVYEQYYKLCCANTNEQLKLKEWVKPDIRHAKNNKVAVIAQSLCDIKADIGILKLNSLSGDISTLLNNFNGEKFLFLPSYMGKSEIESVVPSLKDFDGIYCDGFYGAYLAKKYGKKFFAGVGFNISNSIAKDNLSADYIAISKELTVKESELLISSNTFYLTAGDIKVMDLIYCPFSKTCSSCDKRNLYNLTDENNRVFPIRRYVTSSCRFELYNCAPLLVENNFTCKLIDCSITRDAKKLLKSLDSFQALKEYYNNNYTRGHLDNPVL